MLKTPDIKTWNNVVDCALGDLSTMDYGRRAYGVIKKETDISNNFDILLLYQEALNSNCLSDEAKCAIIEGIRVISKHCKSCKKELTGRLRINVSDNYSNWIETEEYISCLVAEYEEWGYIACIEPTVDLCANLDIEINVQKVCQDIIAKVTANKISCAILADINATKVCNMVRPTINAFKQACTVNPSIVANKPSCEINTDISITNNSLSCTVEDVEIAISDAVLQCAIKTC